MGVVFGHVKGHLWGFRGLRVIDMVPLQVAVISLICLNLCVCVCKGCLFLAHGLKKSLKECSFSFTINAFLDLFILF